MAETAQERHLDHATRSHAWRHRWPSLLGLSSAVLLMLVGGDRDVVAVSVCIAALCYLAAAALDRPWVAWATIPAGGLVVAAGRVLGLHLWAILGLIAVALVAVGVATRAPRPALTAQTLGLAAYGGLAVLALGLAPSVGLVVVAIVLIAHAGWDVVHYRRDVVVPRSLAEYCVLLDVPLGVAALVLAAR